MSVGAAVEELDLFKYLRGKPNIENFKNPFAERGYGILLADSWMDKWPDRRRVWEYEYFFKDDLKISFPTRGG